VKRLHRHQAPVILRAHAPRRAPKRSRDRHDARQ